MLSSRGRKKSAVVFRERATTRTTYRDDSYVKRERGREREVREKERDRETEGENARASLRKRRSVVDESSRARTTGLSYVGCDGTCRGSAWTIRTGEPHG